MTTPIMTRQSGYELHGKDFGFLHVLYEEPERRVVKSGTKLYWKAQCVCGSIKAYETSKLRSGWTRSCGCKKGEMCVSSRGNLKPKEKHPAEYLAWKTMRQRCNNPNKEHYDRYGGRGIKICERWDDFWKFLEDVGPRPSKTHSLHRVDNDGNYEPGNVMWATKEVQANNTVRNFYITADGQTKTAAQWARVYNIPPEKFLSRIKNGWTFSEAVV